MSLERLEAADAPKRDEAGNLLAESVSIASCKHGNLFIRLHGPDGKIFAVASVDAATAVDFGVLWADTVERVLLGQGQACEAVH